MSRRIQPRRQRVGANDPGDPDIIRELEDRREKHERSTRGRPRTPFRQVLHARMHPDVESAPEPSAAPPDAYLGFSPRHAAGLAPAGSRRRSAKVVFKA